MRIKPLIVTTATLLVLTACGSGDSGVGSIGGNLADGGAGQGGAAPKKGTGFKGLPKAGSMAGAARIVNTVTPCPQVRSTRSEYAEDPSRDPDAKYGKSFSVTERGYCGSRDRNVIFLIKDAKVFQAAYKAEVDAGEGGGNVNSGPVIGQDFAAGSESDDTMGALVSPQTGLLILNCHPKFNPPSGYRKEPALVKGCVLTDYYED
ncbi:hypothetical protein ACGFX2_25735 [Streptomyces goshikiensis]|uniref:hypothetical protein n=1 Tax=Streptomyces goshikiensis TaxID=1942 RepID=UPI00371DB678